jgi:hypothetical protein
MKEKNKKLLAKSMFLSLFYLDFNLQEVNKTKTKKTAVTQDVYPV